MKVTLKAQRKDFTIIANFAQQVMLALRNDEMELTDMAKIVMLRNTVEKWNASPTHKPQTKVVYTLKAPDVYSLQLLTKIARYTPTAVLEKIVLHDFNNQINIQLL